MTVSLVSADQVGGGAAGSAAAYFKARRSPAADLYVPASDKAGESPMDRFLKTVRLGSGAAADNPANRSRQQPPSGSGHGSGRMDNLLAQMDSTARGADGQSASTGDLWGQVEPCWRSLPIPARIPVSIEISLDAFGVLREPPKVIRQPGVRIEEARLRAEDRALAALADCLPRHGQRVPAGVYRLEFGAGP